MALFGFGKQNYTNPADEAMPYLEQIPGAVNPYYQPYIDQGQRAGEALEQTYAPMMTDPYGYYNQTMSQYQMSPAAQYQYDELNKQMSGNAAAGGFAGTDYDQQQQADMAQQLIARDQQQYLNDILGIQNTGGNVEKGFYDTGFRASTGYGDILGSNLAQQGQLAYEGSAFENQMKRDRANNRMALLGQMLGLGTGYAMGKSMPGTGSRNNSGWLWG